MPNVLWHIVVSHYNEKARWALDLKGVEHERRDPPPGAHMAVALWLTRGGSKTFPILELEGAAGAIADSTAIIAALEERFPEPPLYPDDPADLDRAVAIEEFFDEEVGPYTRLLAFHELREYPEGLRQFTAGVLPARLASNERVVAGAALGTKAFAQLRYRVASDGAADHARSKIVAGLDRLEEEMGTEPGDYLVGGRLSVADVAAACMLVPLVGPPQGPALPDPAPSYERFRETLRDRPGYRWVETIFARHRQNPRRP